MSETTSATPPPPLSHPPQFLGVLYVATAGQNGSNLGVDEEEVVLMSLAIVNRDGKKLLTSTNMLVHPRGTTKSASSDINENNSSATILSEECRAELGLTDEDVKEGGKSLEDVISELDSIIRRHVTTPSDSLEEDSAESSATPSPLPFALITEGQLPLRQCIHPEASSKEIQLPEYYYSFFDLKKEYCACYDQQNGVESVSEMVKFLELKLSSQEETIVSDEGPQDDPNEDPEENESKGEEGVVLVPAEKGAYKNRISEMTAVVLRLLQDATTFQNPESIMVKLEPGICSKNESVDGNCVVRARGLPWQSSDQDIAKFFRGLNIAKGGVALCLSPQGRRNGEALIRFESQEHRDMALKRHKHHIANRYIEVYKASGEDFLSVAGGNNNEAQAFLSKGGQVIVRMRGLPYDCTAKQVVEFFDSGDTPCKVLDGEEGVLFVKRPDGRATGDAFVQFQHEDDATSALAKHRESIGSRYIELFRSTTAEVQQVLNRCIITAAAAAAANNSSSSNNEPLLKTLPPHALHSDLLSPGQGSLPLITATGQLVQSPVVQSPPASSQLNGPSHILPQHIITSGTRKDCIRLRGLPYEAQVEHILEFLGEHAKNIVYQGVHMVYNAQGQPSGEAFIQMDSEQSAFLAAQSKHHRYMHHFKKQRYIEVFQCSGDDMNLVLTGGVPKQSLIASPHHHHQQQHHQHHHHHALNQHLNHAAAHVHHPGATLIPTSPAIVTTNGSAGQVLIQPSQTPSSTSPSSSSSSCNNPLVVQPHHHHHHHHHPPTSSSSSSLVATAVTTNNYVSPHHHHHAQYYTPHTTVLSAIPPHRNGTGGAAGTTAYYHPATVFYWPYPSPPVSPTYYSHQGIVSPTINHHHHLGIATGHQHHHNALLPPPQLVEQQSSQQPQPQGAPPLLKHYQPPSVVSSQSSDLRLLDITNRSAAIPAEYIIDPHHPAIHHHSPHHHPHNPHRPAYIEKSNGHYRHHHHQTALIANGGKAGTVPGNPAGGAHYMMELGLFMA